MLVVLIVSLITILLFTLKFPNLAKEYYNKVFNKVHLNVEVNKDFVDTIIHKKETEDETLNPSITVVEENEEDKNFDVDVFEPYLDVSVLMRDRLQRDNVQNGKEIGDARKTLAEKLKSESTKPDAYASDSIADDM